MHQHKQIPITSRMSENVAKVARVLNALKLSPDPINYSHLPPGSGTSSGSVRLSRVLPEIVEIIGSLQGKKLIDVACGEISAETKETVMLRCFREMDISPSLYVGIDPSFSAKFLGEQGTEAGPALYLPVSLYELDDSAISALGDADVVITTLFFGRPIGSAANQMMQKMLMSPENKPTEFQDVQASYMSDFLNGGIIREFLEFMAQDYCRRLLSENGWTVHFVLYGEDAPDIEMAEAAGLELKHRKETRYQEGTLFFFTSS